MLKNISAVVFAALLTFTGCEHIKSHFDNHSHDSHSHVVAGPLTLDNGKKWKADTSTLKRVATMQSILKESQAKNALSSRNYLELQNILNGEVDALVRECEMTGPAHEELHKFLNVLIVNVKKLDSNDASEAKITLSKINDELNTFSDFFE